jgi:hypothetical protein
MKRKFAAALFSVAIASCAPVASMPSASLTGQWGGEHAGLMLGSSGGALEYDCAAGTIGPVRAGADGRFVAAGTHTPNTGGPERVGEVRPSYPARYRGSVSGDWMTLRADVPDRGIAIGPYRLRRGAEPMLMRCL